MENEQNCFAFTKKMNFSNIQKRRNSKKKTFKLIIINSKTIFSENVKKEAQILKTTPKLDLLKLRLEG